MLLTLCWKLKCSLVRWIRFWSIKTVRQVAFHLVTSISYSLGLSTKWMLRPRLHIFLLLFLSVPYSDTIISYFLLWCERYPASFQADADAGTFLEEEHSFHDYVDEVQRYHCLVDEITYESVRVSFCSCSCTVSALNFLVAWYFIICTLP